MNRTVKDLKEISENLYKRCYDLCNFENRKNIDDLDISNCFTFAQTNEGSDFWFYVCSKSIEELKSKYGDLYPHYFTPKYTKKRVKVGDKVKIIHMPDDSEIIKLMCPSTPGAPGQISNNSVSFEKGDIVEVIDLGSNPNNFRVEGSRSYWIISEMVEIVNEVPLNSYGFNVGDFLPSSVLDAISNKLNSPNRLFYYLKSLAWKSRPKAFFQNNRVINEIKTIDNESVALISGTMGVYINLKYLRQYQDLLNSESEDKYKDTDKDKSETPVDSYLNFRPGYYISDNLLNKIHKAYDHSFYDSARGVWFKAVKDSFEFMHGASITEIVKDNRLLDVYRAKLSNYDNLWIDLNFLEKCINIKDKVTKKSKSKILEKLPNSVTVKKRVKTKRIKLNK